jgi:uncharacterized protein YoxC
METLTAISVTVIAAIMVLGLIFMIPVLFQICRTAKEAEKLVDYVRSQVAPVSRDIVLISQNVKSIVQSIQRQVDRIEEGVETVYDMSIWAKEFQLELKRRIEGPLFQLAEVIGGIKRGFEAMVRIFYR